jgi:large subunit ribosomal protein L3
MSSMYSSDGKRIPVTLLQLDRCQVVGHKTRQRHGYYAVQIGHGWRDHRNITRPELGHYARVGVAPKEQISEFRVRDETGLVPVGTMMNPSWFKIGQLVDVRGTAKGKGFAGGMKRHGWAGQPASHGNSLAHRAMGSAGGSQGSGSRVIPGKKMAGRMGGQQHTVQNLEVVYVDEENGVIAVKGCLSGPMKSTVKIQDAIKRPGQAKALELPTVPVSLLAAEAAKTAEATA